MAYDERIARRVRTLLAGRPDVAERRMVGGMSFVVGGHLCLGVTSNDLLVRVGPDAYEASLSKLHVRPMAFGSRTLAGYVLVEPEGIQSEAELAGWVERAIEFVSTLPQPEALPGESNRPGADQRTGNPS